MIAKEETTGNSTQLHLNMMTDTLIANIPAENLRSIVRSLVAIYPQITGTFEQQVRLNVQSQAKLLLQASQAQPSLNDLRPRQGIIRCMVGSGMVFDSIPLLSQSIQLTTELSNASGTEPEALASFVASLDGDVVQAMTGVQKALVTTTGIRKLSSTEREVVEALLNRMRTVRNQQRTPSGIPLLDRAFTATAQVLGYEDKIEDLQLGQTLQAAPPSAQETFSLGGQTLPRIFSGLWQMSSPSWGSASIAQIMQQFTKHVQGGFTAFDMADHYGDAELIFGRFRSHYTHQDSLFAATKLCVFNHMPVVSKEAMSANVSERCRRLQMSKLDLLQFHWQHYEEASYLDALRYLAADDRVGMLGLCNFDTAQMKRVLDAGITIHTNQVQFSLIDSRPVMEMATVCEEHNIKLLTYGTLCGGFLSDKYLDQPEPDLYGQAGGITPSQRKYYSMISNWGGWDLFQDLLRLLRAIATKHGVPGISNVATRWVLDHGYVGAVIVGARMGISDHSDANAATFGWTLDESDQGDIEALLQKSRRRQMYGAIGDCGAEYRS